MSISARVARPAAALGAPGKPRRFIPALPTLDPRLLLSRQREATVFPLDRLRAPGRQLFYLARAGVFHAVSHLVGPRGGTVLMPAYHHGVEVEAVRATGVRLLFYRVDAQMQVDLDDLAAKMRLPNVRLVYVTHYVGFPQPVDDVRRLGNETGLPLLEDCALALLSCHSSGRPLGSTGEAAVFSLYKSLPVPHGGVLVSASTPTVTVRRPRLTSTLHHLAGSLLSHLELTGGRPGAWVRAVSRATAHSTIDAVAETVKTGTQHLRPIELSLGASALVSALLPQFDLPTVALRRRRNYTRLAERLRGVVPVIGDPLPDGACPLFLPVRVQDKPAVLRTLRSHGIEAIDFWGTQDPACPAEAFPEVAALRREVVELPIHQSLDDAAIDFVAACTREAVARA